jgi:hypothetical protein
MRQHVTDGVFQADLVRFDTVKFEGFNFLMLSPLMSVSRRRTYEVGGTGLSVFRVQGAGCRVEG